MDQEGIENSYSAVVSALRRSGFSVPAHGWPAELVAAHVCLNNDLTAEVGECGPCRPRLLCGSIS
jgi:hypothetical protein